MNAERQSKNRQFRREPARRVFAAELREARLQFKDGDDEKSPSFVLLPSGERCNRIFLVGKMTQKDKRGDQNVFYTVRVEDPSGMFFINAGSYQEEAMRQIRQIEPGTFVAVIGKPTVRTTPDGAVFISVRAETVIPVDEATSLTWVLDAAARTLERLDHYGSTDDSRKAREFYTIDPVRQRQMVYDALVRIQP
ncbi:MAG: nucleic acid-binding protein [Methanomicrobiales archaeon]|nr:nucleic acid-binding protein [Methanomicrobiales archaeon]